MTVRSLYCFVALTAFSVSVGWSQTNATEAAVEDLYAEALAARRSGDLNGAIAKYQAILKLSPKLAAAHNNLGLLYFQQSNFPAAAQAFEQGLLADPKMTASLTPLGSAYFQMAQFAKAKAVLDRAVRLTPRDENAQLYRARTMFSLGEREAAADALQKLLVQAPHNIEALYTLGQMYMQLAQVTLKQLNKEAPDSYLSNLVSGQLLTSMEDYDGALAQFKKALEKQPGFRGAHYNIGNIYWLEGKWTEAIVEFKQELGADQFNCLAHWKIANSLLNLREDQKTALSAAQTALQLCPDLAQAHLDLGRLLADTGDYPKAVEHYRRVLQLAPEESTAHFHLATAYRRMGKTEEANAETRILQEMSPKAPAPQDQRK
ncbi:MAG: tetratricopeptide repeat protein [Bryobacteraceae bacterium]